MRLGSSFAIALLIVLDAGVIRAQENTAVTFRNFSADPSVQDSLLLRDLAGVPLSQSDPNTNSDGRLIQLGYFSQGTIGNNFLGDWIPMTGFVPQNRTSVGDSAFLDGSGNGIISFSAIFLLGTNDVRIYNEGDDPGAYVTQSSFSISLTQPPNDQVLAIRFYDTDDGLSGFFNTVSSDSNTWFWRTPTTDGGGATVLIDFETTTLEFQDELNRFRTSVAVPEASTCVLMCLGMAGLFMAQRRLRRGDVRVR